MTKSMFFKVNWTLKSWSVSNTFYTCRNSFNLQPHCYISEWHDFSPTTQRSPYSKMHIYQKNKYAFMQSLNRLIKKKIVTIRLHFICTVAVDPEPLLCFLPQVPDTRVRWFGTYHWQLRLTQKVQHTYMTQCPILNVPLVSLTYCSHMHVHTHSHTHTFQFCHLSAVSQGVHGPGKVE